jgi:uncharacterized protein (DUF302 family)
VEILEAAAPFAILAHLDRNSWRILAKPQDIQLPQVRPTTRDRMATKQIAVQRFSVVSSKTFDAVVAVVDAGIGHPDMNAFQKNVGSAKTQKELEKIVGHVVGLSGLMEFTRFDLGAILRKGRARKGPRVLRLVAGNPLIMKEMVKHVHDAGSYAPVTILIDERSDGVHLSYDRMASFLASYGNVEALKVAQDLDSKVEALLTSAAA